MQGAGIASIICLLDEDQLPLSRRSLTGGLLAHYREHGFALVHIPTTDGQGEPFTTEQLERAWEAYQRLPKPVLVHCSAGHDRTGRVITHILNRLSSDED
jgi:protein-tyrosine phosphatase